MSDSDRYDLAPLAAYPTGTRLAGLRTAEAFVTVAARLWTARRLEPAACHPDWRAGFLAADVRSVGAACFDSFLNIVATAARQPVELGCPHCPSLTEDEARLLCALALLQNERSNDAALLLADWLPPAAIRVAVDYGVGFAMALAEARLRLQQRRGVAADPHRRTRQHLVFTGDSSIVH